MRPQTGFLRQLEECLEVEKRREDKRREEKRREEKRREEKRREEKRREEKRREEKRRGTQEAPRSPERHPGSTQEAPRAPRRHPGGTKGPRELQNAYLSQIITTLTPNAKSSQSWSFH